VLAELEKNEALFEVGPKLDDADLVHARHTQATATVTRASGAADGDTEVVRVRDLQATTARAVESREQRRLVYEPAHNHGERNTERDRDDVVVHGDDGREGETEEGAHHALWVQTTGRRGTGVVADGRRCRRPERMSRMNVSLTWLLGRPSRWTQAWT
jgi:hypothetical protein